MINILGIAGSLRKDSYNKALLNSFIDRAPVGVAIDIADIAALPLFNEDLEADFPSSARILKDKIEAASAVIISTPEYNRGTSGALKNAIDWASRPSGNNSFKNKPVLVIGASTGLRGANIAQYDIKRSMTYLGARVVGQPEFYLDTAEDKFDSSGKLIDEKTKEQIDKVLTALIESV